MPPPRVSHFPPPETALSAHRVRGDEAIFLSQPLIRCRYLNCQIGYRLRLRAMTTGETILIGLGEYAVTKTPGTAIKTLGLGSCVAVTASHVASGTIAMAHIVLPESKMDPAKAAKLPGYFADTAIIAMFEELSRVSDSDGRYIVKLAGGAAVLTMSPANENMNIGKRNILATKKALWKRGLGAIAEDLGGTESRSVKLNQESLVVEISRGNQIIKKL